MGRERIIRGYLRHRLVVTMHDGATWDGVVMDVDSRTVVLRNAEAIGANDVRTPADGEVLLPRDEVAFMQAVPEMQRP